MDHERVLAALDKEVDAARRTLDQLASARQSYAQAHGLTGRKAVTAIDGGVVTGSLVSVVLRVMKDGTFWHVEDVTAAVQQERTAAKATVNTALARGALDGGPFEHGPRKGTYRVRPEVVAGWSGGVGAAPSA